MSRNSTQKGGHCQQIIVLFFCRAKMARDKAGEILARETHAQRWNAVAPNIRCHVFMMWKS